MSNVLADAMKMEETKTYTENGLECVNTTNNACLDLFATIGALRQRSNSFGGNGKVDLQPIRAQRLFEEAVKENKLIAAKTLFYARDVRGGLGERDVVKNLLAYAAKRHPEMVRANMDLIGVYGRYDDLYAFIGTPLENDMWVAMKNQFEEDRRNLTEGNAISLLAKWIKTPDASSKRTRELGILTAKKLGYSVYEFKRILRAMRKHLNVIETLMSTNKWDEIKYAAVPSRAMMIYRNAFMHHDEERFNTFLNDVANGKETINASTLYPYDIVEKFLNARYEYRHGSFDMSVLEAQWKALPDYVNDDTNVLVMADVSGSMSGRPMASSIGLALYFAEHSHGAFKDMFMTFSEKPKICKVKGDTLAQKIEYIHAAEWGGSTNIEAAFDMVLDLAVKNHAPQTDMPKSIVIISDMEFDAATGSPWNNNHSNDWLFYDKMKKRFEAEGYTIPNIVFWNVESRHDTFHVDADRTGVQLVSGQSASTFKNLIQCIDMTPVEAMLKILGSERYAAVTIDAA